MSAFPATGANEQEVAANQEKARDNIVAEIGKLGRDLTFNELRQLVVRVIDPISKDRPRIEAFAKQMQDVNPDATPTEINTAIDQVANGWSVRLGSGWTKAQECFNNSI